MTCRKPISLLAGAALILLAALTVAACGSGSVAATAATTPAPSKTTSGAPAAVGVANSSLGKILVGSQGRALYLDLRE